MRLIDADKLIEYAENEEEQGNTFCIESAEELEIFIDDVCGADMRGEEDGNEGTS